MIKDCENVVHIEVLPFTIEGLFLLQERPGKADTEHSLRVRRWQSWKFDRKDSQEQVHPTLENHQSKNIDILEIHLSTPKRSEEHPWEEYCSQGLEAWKCAAV